MDEQGHSFTVVTMLRMDGSGDLDQAGVEIEDQGHGLGLWFYWEYDTGFKIMDIGHWAFGTGYRTWNTRLWKLELGFESWPLGWLVGWLVGDEGTGARHNGVGQDSLEQDTIG